MRPDLQNLNLQTLVSILNSTKATDIPGIVKALSTDAQDTLMKYLYKGMALPEWGDVSGSVLLGWHEKVRLRSLVSSHAGLTVLPCAVDGGSGNWLHCARDDGQKTCMMNLKHRMYNICGMLSQAFRSPEVPLRTLELARRG